MIRLSTNKRGFTLVEALLTIVVISIGLVGMMILYQNVTRGAMDGDLTVASSFLARERLEQIISDKVAYGYSYVTQVQYAGNQVIMLGPRAYTRAATVSEVSKSDFTTSQSGSGYKLIAVSVQWGAGPEQRIILSTVLSEY